VSVQSFVLVMVHTQAVYVIALKVGKVQNVTYLPTIVNLQIALVEDNALPATVIVKLDGKDPNVMKVVLETLLINNCIRKYM
jgi:hypothetical protein